MWSFFLRLVGIAGFLAFCAFAVLLVVNRTPATKTAEKGRPETAGEAKADPRPLIPENFSLLTRERVGGDQPDDSATRFSRTALDQRMAVGFQPPATPSLRGVDTEAPAKEAAASPQVTSAMPCVRLGFSIPADRFTLRAGLLERQGGADPSKRVMVGQTQWQARLAEDPGGCQLVVEGELTVADAATASLRLIFRAVPKEPVLLQAMVENARFQPAGSLAAEPPRVRLSGGVPSVPIASQIEGAGPERIMVRFNDGAEGGEKKPDVLAMHWIDFAAIHDGVPFVLTAELPDAMILLGQRTRRIDMDSGPPITGSNPDAGAPIDADALSAVETEPLSGNP